MDDAVLRPVGCVSRTVYSDEVCRRVVYTGWCWSDARLNVCHRSLVQRCCYFLPLCVAGLWCGAVAVWEQACLIAAFVLLC